MIEKIKELREKTGAGVMECKKALLACNGDFNKALAYIKETGAAKAAKKAKRKTKEGKIGSYIHAGGKIGVLVEILCETDFVANTEEFQNFVKDISMQIAATSPKYIKLEDIPEEEKKEKIEVYRTEAISQGKPEKVVDRIAEGKFRKYAESVCLLEQPFIKDEKISIKELLNSLIAKLGENIVISRFARFQIGEV